jgi:hypothetical protein
VRVARGRLCSPLGELQRVKVKTFLAHITLLAVVAAEEVVDKLALLVEMVVVGVVVLITQKTV